MLFEHRLCLHNRSPPLMNGTKTLRSCFMTLAFPCAPLCLLISDWPSLPRKGLHDMRAKCPKRLFLQQRIQISLHRQMRNFKAGLPLYILAGYCHNLGCVTDAVSANQPYPRAPDLVWPGHLHGSGCLSARAVGTGFPTVGLRLWLGPGCGWSWVLFTPARCGWGLGWVCLGSVCGVVPLLPAVCGVPGWALVSACFRDLCGFVRVSLAPRRFRFRCAVWACVLGPGLSFAPPFLAGLSGCVFCALFFFPLLGVPVPGLVVSPPVSFLSGWAAGFFFFCVSACFGAPFPGGPLFLAWCCRFWLGGPPVPLWGPVFGALLLGGLAPFCVVGGWFGGCGLFPRAPPPFFWGGGARLAVPPFAFLSGACSVAGVWCGWSLATPGGGSCVLLPAGPGWVSLPVLVGGPRHSWLGSAGGGGVWCVAVVCWWGCGWCI